LPSHGHFIDDSWHHAGELVGKPVSFFVSTASQGGGQETTIMTAITQAAHHGMIYVPPGYTHGAPMYDMSEVRGGSPWGAGCFAAPDGSRQPSTAELAYATHQGEYFAGKALKLAA
jgi:NAD(P)H dehydrogenase (quinone)